MLHLFLDMKWLQGGILFSQAILDPIRVPEVNLGLVRKDDALPIINRPMSVCLGPFKALQLMPFREKWFLCFLLEWMPMF
jgi:hypothetical protein